MPQKSKSLWFPFNNDFLRLSFLQDCHCFRFLILDSRWGGCCCFLSGLPDLHSWTLTARRDELFYLLGGQHNLYCCRPTVDFILASKTEWLARRRIHLLSGWTGHVSAEALIIRRPGPLPSRQNPRLTPSMANASYIDVLVKTCPW